LLDRTLLSGKLYSKSSLRVAFHHDLGEINYVSLIHLLPRVGDHLHKFGTTSNIM
jgi:hypothetical protein